MATIRELAEKFVERLSQASDPEDELLQIAAEINSLTQNGKPISEEGKSSIVKAMAQTGATKENPAGGFIKEAENKAYLALVQKLQLLLKK